MTSSRALGVELLVAAACMLAPGCSDDPPAPLTQRSTPPPLEVTAVDIDEAAHAQAADPVGNGLFCPGNDQGRAGWEWTLGPFDDAATAALAGFEAAARRGERLVGHRIRIVTSSVDPVGYALLLDDDDRWRSLVTIREGRDGRFTSEGFVTCPPAPR